ncbi:uncharacterized protein LOC142326196 isoform X2 [Lycorma delicatula]|uniref:uncharacterized protein LOC142326196 isoform X2 n=1 Tax=Lycorma delicatula TaxID=130591 RepID=UPI003F5130A7
MTNMSNKVAEISDPTHHTSLMTSLRQFITTESFVDVQFICQGGHKVFAHKLMLISVSRLLKKILTENPNSNEMITIHLPDVNSKLLRIVVNFLYIGYMRLNSVEMDQFKLVLGLLDIELFQKNPEQNCPTEVNVDPLNVPNNIHYVSNSASVAPGVINSSVAVENQMYCQRNSQNEYVPVAQTVTPVVPVGNRPHQYLAIHSNQAPSSHNERMVSYSSGPVVPGTGGMVVQQNVTNVPAAHEIVLQGQNQYSTYVSNVLTSPVTAAQATSNSVPTNLIAVPVSSISQLSAQQISVQAPLNVQQHQPQMSQVQGQQVRLYPGTQNQTLITKNGPFQSSSSESRVIATAQPQLSKGYVIYLKLKELLKATDFRQR